MIKNCLKMLTIVTLLSLFVFPTVAASLSLTNIGALTTNGSKYSEWWYTVANPTLKGTANADSDVKIKINSDESTVKADSAGNWTFSSTMATGNYPIVISSGSESYSFTLHVGQGMPASVGGSGDTTQGTATTPDTGSHQLLGIAGSLTLIGIGLMIYINSRRNKKAYVSSVLKSLK
jgi:hypothetical protein